MRRWFIGFGIIGGLVLSIVVQSNTVTLASGAARDGWVSLFDGKTLKGWQVHKGGDWKVENGAIACPGTSAGWLQTLAPSSDYVLKLQFLAASTANSGVFRPEKKGYPGSPDMNARSGPTCPPASARAASSDR